MLYRRPAPPVFARLDRDDPDFAELVREGRMGLAKARDAWLELNSSSVVSSRLRSISQKRHYAD